MEDEIGVYRFEGVSSLWREIFPLGSTKSSTWGHRQVGVSTTLCLSLQKTNKQTVDATDDLCSTIRKRGRNNDLNHGFGQQFSSEQLQQRVHDVLPALPQDVAMPMSEVEHRLGGCLGLTVTAKHGGKILHRLCDTQTLFTHLNTLLLLNNMQDNTIRSFTNSVVSVDV